MYRRVAAESPHGDGSISMLENLLSRWKGKLFVLALLGFASHQFHNHYHALCRGRHGTYCREPVCAGSSSIFCIIESSSRWFDRGSGRNLLRGFKEAIGIAVFWSLSILLLNLTVVAVGFYEIATHPTVFWDWRNVSFSDLQQSVSDDWNRAHCLSKLALGLSGFETGVVVMPLVKGDGKAITNR